MRRREITGIALSHTHVHTSFCYVIMDVVIAAVNVVL